MMKLIRKLGLASAGALAVAALALPASAATAVAPGANVVLVQGHRHHYRHDRSSTRIIIRNGDPYYHGHRGYRHYRRGYRHYHGYWFPPAAFIAGAIIGGAIANSPPAGSAHVRWCEQHYRSYDVRTDTYQPYNGPRRRCVSPY